MAGGAQPNLHKVCWPTAATGEKSERKLDKTNLIARGRSALRLYQDREYFKRLFSIALPIILQDFISASLNLVASVMIGQKGDASVAAVGLSNQISFLHVLLLFGVNSGAAIFIAQLWGRRDIANIRRVVGLALALSLSAGTLFTLASVLAPQALLGVYSRDAEVLRLGTGYLRIFGLSFLFTAVTFTYAAALRSTGDVRTPLLVSLSALSLNTFLAFTLIFGKLGLPALGINGAALALLIARIVESSVLVLITYRRKAPPAATIRDVARLDREFTANVLRRILPVTVNEMLWSLGITTYNIVYARIGTESIAATNIAFTLDNLALVFFIGIAHACAILVGNWIGADDERQAFQYAARTLGLSMLGAMLMGLLITAGSEYFLALYKVSPQVTANARGVLFVIAGLLWLRVSNLLLFVGILRSGGDTRFGFIVDVGAIWVIGVPMALLGAFVLRLPVYYVYLMVMTEELIKWVVCLFRFASKKWIHNLARGIEEISPG